MARLTSFVVALLIASITSTSAIPKPYYKGCTNCIASPNNCDITAPCSSFGGSLFCGCRPGYKATTYAISDTDTSKQWRIDTLSGHEHRVWTAPGVVCDTMCQYPFGSNPCGERRNENAPTVSIHEEAMVLCANGKQLQDVTRLPLGVRTGRRNSQVIDWNTKNGSCRGLDRGL